MTFTAKKFLKIFLVGISIYILTVLALLFADIIWMSPPYYNVTEYEPFDIPIMSMKDYDEIVNDHRRPYYFSVSNSNGVVHIIGVDHTSDLSHPHLDSIRVKWEQAGPSVALVESRLGFLFTWGQNPIEKYGERGLTAFLAKKDNAQLYTWEPNRSMEVSFLLEKYPGKQLSLFYVLRPYFSYSINYRKNNTEALLNQLIKERTDYSGLRNQFQSWNEIQEILENDYPEFDWKSHVSSDGWPDGYLYDIWNDSNQFRNRHMIQVIKELVAKGEIIFVTMGASHAPRIEKTLTHELLN